jgi:amino acid transporter
MAASGTFLKLVVLSTLAVVCVYALACAAAFVLHRKHVALAGPPMNLSILPAAAGVGMLGMVAMVVSAQWRDVAGLVAVVVGSLAVFAVTGRRT